MKQPLLAALALFAVPILHADEAPHRYIVATRSMTRLALPQILRDDLPPRSDRFMEGWDLIDGFAADLTDSEVAQLRRSRNVAYIEQAVERHLMSASPKPAAQSDIITPGGQTTPYGVSMVNAPAVWTVSRGAAKGSGAPTHVAIIDTGIDYHHPELANAYKGGTDLVNGDDDPLDDQGHGTHVAGIIAAANNGQGVIGVAPAVDLYSVKVLNSCGTTTTNDVLISAMQWIANKKQQVGGNWVVNMSLGGGAASSAEQTAFQTAADAGILVFAASGNSFDPANPVYAIAYPAAYPSNVAIGAIDSSMTVADFSQRGPELKLVAPGVDVLSTFFGGHVSTNDGRNFVGTLPDASDVNQRPICLSRPQVSGTFVFCGYGGSLAEFPLAVAGKVALISRGNGIKFTDKVANAKASGAIGVIIYDNVDEMVFPPSLANTTKNQIVPTLFLSNHDGLDLRNTPSVTVTLGSSATDFLYASLQGTSMATPHAAAVAALVWSLAPSASRQTVLNALLTTARDLGGPGVDQTYGYGLVDAWGAALVLDPAEFPPTALRGRTILKRGH